MRRNENKFLESVVCNDSSEDYGSSQRDEPLGIAVNLSLPQELHISDSIGTQDVFVSLEPASLRVAAIRRPIHGLAQCIRQGADGKHCSAYLHRHRQYGKAIRSRTASVRL
jgi:hypothetical protein